MEVGRVKIKIPTYVESLLSVNRVVRHKAILIRANPYRSILKNKWKLLGLCCTGLV